MGYYVQLYFVPDNYSDNMQNFFQAGVLLFSMVAIGSTCKQVEKNPTVGKSHQATQTSGQQAFVSSKEQPKVYPVVFSVPENTPDTIVQSSARPITTRKKSMGK